MRFLLQQPLHRRHHHLFMAFFMAYDPSSLFRRAFSEYPSLSSHLSSSPFLRKLVYANVFRVNESGGYTLKRCFDSSAYSNSDNVFLKIRSRGFSSLPRPTLLPDFKDYATLVNIDNTPLTASPTKPVRFHDHHLSQKLIVAVDVDEVLGNFVSALNQFIADQYSSNYSVSEYHVYEFFKIWNCSRDEADIRVHEFFKTPYFKSGIQPIPGAQRALQKLSRFCNLSVVTSRQNAIKDHTIAWIEKYYPGLFKEIHFGNHFALDGLSRPKSEICRSLGAKVLIDDNPRYAIECAEAGIRVLLFDYENSYPWCKSECVDQQPLVTKVKNWEEVELQLMSLVAS
ncbi:uncharacterized protein G2W53_011708 [Senna tora]|uniref:Tac7077 n=1 Tax=Senna tora TaxID=362788 RepID=A0A835CBI2_9FABA|nr:uncharacterized protein G2W53_011708 [Senna tora]